MVRNYVASRRMVTGGREWRHLPDERIGDCITISGQVTPPRPPVTSSAPALPVSNELSTLADMAAAHMG